MSRRAGTSTHALLACTVLAAVLTTTLATVLPASSEAAPGAPPDVLASSAPDPASAGRYHPLPPRLFHESVDVVRPGMVAARRTTRLHVLGANGVPAYRVRAVMLEVTASRAAKNGRVDLVGGGRAGTPRLLVHRRERTSNQMLAIPDAAGDIALRSTTTALLEVRMVGWVGSPTLTGAGLVQVPRAKHVVDTTTGRHTTRRPLKGSRARSVSLTASSPRPPSSFSAVVANVRVLHPTRSGYLEIYPSGTRRPGRPQVALTRGVDTSSQLTLPIDRSGAVSLFLLAGRADVKIDVQGYVTSTRSSASAAGMHLASAPVRALDTRTSRAVPRKRTTTFPVAGHYGVPAEATSVVASVSVVGTRTSQTAAVGPDGGLSKDAPSTLWARRNHVTTTTLTLPLGPTGAVRLRRNSGHVVIDVIGWTVPTPLVVREPDLSDLAPPAVPGPDAALGQEVLVDTVRYAMGTWWDDVRLSLVDQRLNQTQSKRSVRLERHPSPKTVKNDPLADPVRRVAMTSFAVATALATDSWDAERIGVSETVGRTRVVELIQRLVQTHVSQQPGGWGAGVQGSLWAGYAGRAAWLVWDDLSDVTRGQVAEMIALEANDVAGQRLPYLRDDADRLLRPGNSGGEEISWSALPVQLALAMMPTSEERVLWNAVVVRNALASWARPSDTASQMVVNGAPVSAWIDGSNIEPDGTMVNHKRIAPDYMANMSQTLDHVWVQATVGGRTPRAATLLLCPVYRAFTQVNYATPTFPSPGGSIYRPNSAEVYYPEGVDWGPGMQLPYALIDTQISGFGVCAGLSASDYATQHLQAARAMQQRFTDGHTFLDSSEFNYVGREELTGQLAAQVVLSMRARDAGAVAFTDATVGAL